MEAAAAAAAIAQVKLAQNQSTGVCLRVISASASLLSGAIKFRKAGRKQSSAARNHLYNPLANGSQALD